MSKKVLDSGTAIASLIEEARLGWDRTDFAQRIGLATREAFKTNFWLRLLRDCEKISVDQASSMLIDCEELQKMLVTSRKTARNER